MSDISQEQFTDKTREQLNGYVKFADQKASILITAQLAFIGLYSNILQSRWEDSIFSFKIFSVLSILFGITAAGLAGWIVYPRSQDTEKGLMLWKSIDNMGFESYKEEVKSLDSEKILDEMLDENHKLATIASTKYKYFRCALVFTAGMLILGLLSISLLFI